MLLTIAYGTSARSSKLASLRFEDIEDLLDRAEIKLHDRKTDEETSVRW